MNQTDVTVTLALCTRKYIMRIVIFGLFKRRVFMKALWDCDLDRALSVYDRFKCLTNTFAQDMLERILKHDIVCTYDMQCTEYGSIKGRANTIVTMPSMPVVFLSGLVFTEKFGESAMFDVAWNSAAFRDSVKCGKE